MIVDDEPSSINSIRSIILKKPEIFCIVGESYNANNAFKLMQNVKPDILFTDIKMPGSDGIDLIRLVENSKMYPDIVIIVISGYDDFSFVHDAFVFGVEDYLLKPVNPVKFLAMLDDLKIKLDNHNAIKKEIEENKTGEAYIPEKIVYISKSKELLTDIEEYVSTHTNEDISIASICKAFSISQPYLSKIFKNNEQCTFNEYVTNVKIQKAKDLLQRRKDLLISTVSSLSGFSDQFYFSKVFKSKSGVTPTEFRNKFEI
jgi:YesN/AraC family two-component response regulator